MSRTHENRSDGFGAQYQGIITTYICCAKHSVNYKYTQLSYVEHNYNNDMSYINKLEDLMNLKENIETNHDNTSTEIKFFDVSSYFENNIDECCASNEMKFVKECFWKNKEKNHFKNNKINIAVHIRRENFHDRGQAGNRANVPNTYYLNIMNELREKYKDKELLFHIYSQGTINNFEVLQKEDVEFHLDEEITKTFVGLVAADILIISPSSFSYVAALLSDGIVYYKQFWHNPKKDWIIN
jgi:hypothetical protein